MGKKSQATKKFYNVSDLRYTKDKETVSKNVDENVGTSHYPTGLERFSFPLLCNGLNFHTEQTLFSQSECLHDQERKSHHRSLKSVTWGQKVIRASGICENSKPLKTAPPCLFPPASPGPTCLSLLLWVRLWTEDSRQNSMELEDLITFTMVWEQETTGLFFFF